MRYLLIGVALVLAGAGGCGGEPGGGAEGRIVFSSSRDGDFEIYAMDADGGNVRQLTRNRRQGANEADDRAPAWSPDGRRVVFTSTRDHDGDGFTSEELYVMAADGGGETRLTENTGGEGSPSWAPDGESILYWRTAVGGLTRGGPEDVELALVSLTGAAAGVLLRSDGFVHGELAPDGSRLVFTRCAAEGGKLDCEIWVAEADGSGRRKLVDSGGRDFGATWSPDGRRLAFVSDRDRNGDCFFHDCLGHNGEIYVVGADGSNPSRLTDDPGDDGSPAWSPDGRMIAFSALRGVEGAVDAPDEDYEIYVMAADGSDARPVTDNTAWDLNPDWG